MYGTEIILGTITVYTGYFVYNDYHSMKALQLSAKNRSTSAFYV